MVEVVTNKGKLLLVKLWNENRKSEYELVQERAIEMLHGAFNSPEEMVMYVNYSALKYRVVHRTERNNLRHLYFYI